MTQNELNFAATCITAMASQPDAQEKIRQLLLNLITAHSEPVAPDRQSCTLPKLNFTSSEINAMPKTFRTEFRAEGCTAHVRKRKCGKNSYTYDIRYRRNGYAIYVTNKNLETAKKLFLERLKTAQSLKDGPVVPKTFHSFSVFYFENVRDLSHRLQPLQQTFEALFQRNRPQKDHDSAMPKTFRQSASRRQRQNVGRTVLSHERHFSLCGRQSPHPLQPHGRRSTYPAPA